MSKDFSRSFLKRLAESEAFDLATKRHYWSRGVNGGLVRDSGRMTNRELVLRFCAFKNYSAEEYRKHSSLDAFLVEFTRRLDGVSTMAPVISDNEVKELELAFERGMLNASAILDDAAFRRWPIGARRGPINRAVFESQAIALSDFKLDQLLPNKREIATGFRELFSDPEYSKAVTVATGDPKSVAMRLSVTKTVLKSIVG